MIRADGIVRLTLPGLLIASAVLFLTGINWGLPSRRADPYLFGSRTPWTGQEILDLAGGWDADAARGADVDVNPVERGSEPVILNATDVQRAEIVRRYRLYSYQPDEMITFRALSKIKPGERKFDPMLYQYGGLWIYPVGAMLKLADSIGYLDLRPDLAFYLDHPEEFGKFYIVARLYSALWGVVGVWAVWRLVLRITGNKFAGAAAAACFALMPVVVNMAHEAKPHLPGAVLMLLAVLAGSKYAETGQRKWWMTAGALCGAAGGMVLSSFLVFAILPAMTLLRKQPWRERITVTLAAAVIGIDVYFITNPYVLIHLVQRDGMLTSNLGNSTAMYALGISLGGIVTAARSLIDGTGLALGFVGLLGTIFLSRRAWKMLQDDSQNEIRRRATGLLLTVPALLIAIQFVLLAREKPGEYGRFALYLDAFLAVEAIAATFTFLTRRIERIFIVASIILLTFVPTLEYLKKFSGDRGENSTRLQAAAVIADDPGFLKRPIGVWADPAPYSLPPVNLFSHRIKLLHPSVRRMHESRAGATIVVPDDSPSAGSLPPADPVEALLPPRISWAGKRFSVREKH